MNLQPPQPIIELNNIPTINIHHGEQEYQPHSNNDEQVNRDETLREELWFYLVPDVYTIDHVNMIEHYKNFRETKRMFKQFISWKRSYSKQPFMAFVNWFKIEDNVTYMFTYFLALSIALVFEILSILSIMESLEQMQLGVFVVSVLLSLMFLFVILMIMFFAINYFVDLVRINNKSLSHYLLITDNNLVDFFRPFTYVNTRDKKPLQDLLEVISPELIDKFNLNDKTAPNFTLTKEEICRLIIDVHDVNPDLNTPPNECELLKADVRKRYMKNNHLTVSELKILVEAHHKLIKLKSAGLPMSDVSNKITHFVEQQMLLLDGEQQFEPLYDAFKTHIIQAFGAGSYLIDEFANLTIEDTQTLCEFKQKHGLQILVDIAHILKHNPNLTLPHFHDVVRMQNTDSHASSNGDEHKLILFLEWIVELRQSLIDEISNRIMETN